MGATIIVLLLIALIPASIASKKGKSFGLWYVYGVCLWIVALIHSLVLPDESQNQNNNSANNSYKPYEPITKTESVINTVNKVKCTSVQEIMYLPKKTKSNKRQQIQKMRHF